MDDVAAVRGAFEDSQLIPDWLEQCQAYDEEPSDTCKSLADLPRPREWVLAVTNRNRSITERAGIAKLSDVMKEVYVIARPSIMLNGLCWPQLYHETCVV